MSDISREKVKCAKCGKESQQLVVYSVNYSLGDKETNDKLVSHKQKCPYCGYEAISIDSLSDKLKREEIVKITEEFINNFNKYEIFKIPNELYLDYFRKIEDKFNAYDFEEDSRFVTYGRLSFLKEELTQRLDDDKLRYEEPNSVCGKGKWDNRMGAFIDLWDYIRGDRHFTPTHIPQGLNFREILQDNDQYYKDGLICKQERDILLEMIKEIKSFIKNNQSSSEIKKDNKSKKLILKIVDNDWGLKTIYTWSTKTWCIYSDLSVDYEVRNGEDKTKSYSHNINEEELKQIIKNIDLAKSDNREVQACDGEAWEFVQYENDNIVWERKLGYIYGIESLETICDMLRNLVKDDSDIFIADEMEENDMGLFSKKDKYDIDAKDNTPQFVYGIPDSMRKKWAKEDEKKNKKYDIDVEKNMPREVYGIPDSMRNKNKYDIKPEDNMPQRVYGVPNHQTKYDVKPEDNIPQKVYGVPFFDNKNTKKCPYCNSTELWKYLYGEPTHDYDKDKYVLGGCEITENQPTYKCKKCGKDIYPDNNFVMPKITTKKSIRIGIKNDKSNYVMLLNHVSEPEMYDLLFADLNNLDGKSISDLSTNVPERYYSQFVSKLYSIISNWEDDYQGESNVEWNIKLNTENNTRLISGNGGFPSNWNEFIDLISEYEKIFKNKKKIDIEKIHELNPQFNPNGVYTFMELLRSDPTKAEEIIKSGFKNKDVIPPTNTYNGNNKSEEEMLKEIENEVDNEMIERGLLTVKDGRKIPAFGSIHVRWEIEKKLLKERYNYDWKTPAEKNPGIMYD